MADNDTTTPAPDAAAPDAAPPEAPADTATPLVDEAEVRAVLERVRPFLQSDGGDLEFIELDGTVVTIRLQGSCVGCPSSIYTLKMGIENQLREEVPAVTELIAVQ